MITLMNWTNNSKRVSREVLEGLVNKDYYRSQLQLAERTHSKEITTTLTDDDALFQRIATAWSLAETFTGYLVGPRDVEVVFDIPGDACMPFPYKPAPEPTALTAQEWRDKAWHDVDTDFAPPFYWNVPGGSSNVLRLTGSAGSEEVDPEWTEAVIRIISYQETTRLHIPLGYRATAGDFTDAWSGGRNNHLNLVISKSGAVSYLQPYRTL